MFFPIKFIARCMAASTVFALCLLTLVSPAHTQQNQTPPTKAGLVQKSGKYTVQLRLPADGLFAEEETDIEFHVADASQDDPVQGPPPVVNASVVATVTMPVMPSMPQQKPRIHREGVAGDYGVVVYFPHGGDYQVALAITPPNEPAFTVAFVVPVGDAGSVRGRKVKPRPYTLEVSSQPASPKAGEPTDLNIVVRSRDTKQPVTDYDTVHTKQIHFMVVSVDLQHFAHEHPTANPDGTFTLRYTFPTGGEYHLFADVAPKGAGSQILMQPIKVAGPVPPAIRLDTLPTALTDTVGGVKAALQTAPNTLPVGHSLNLTFTLQDAATGAPITDVEPYLGAMAHLMLIHQDGATFVHSHPDETDPKNGHEGAITFLARFPKPGVYRGWLQFQRHGDVQTAAFTWTVKAAKSEATR